MTGLIHSLPFEARASAKVPKHKDTSGTCRERATADLLKSVAMITANERLIRHVNKYPLCPDGELAGAAQGSLMR